MSHLLDTTLAAGRAVLAIVVALLGAGCAGMGGPVHERHEPLSAVAPAELADQAAARAGEACGTKLREQLMSGRATPGSCSALQSSAARATILHNGVRFGIVEHRQVELDRIRLRLGEARLCRGWPLPIEDDQGVVLHQRDAERAGCMLRPYRGQLVLTAVRADGERQQAALLEVDRDGVAIFEFAEVDASLRRATGKGLDDFSWLELGETGWAGTINLVRMRQFIADWHFVWAARGRGSVALFAERHAEHPRSDDARAMALEGRLERQRQDFEAVSEGTMTASAFLERHVWSPFRRAVEDLTVTAQ